jgi:hypothetical protein
MRVYTGLVKRGGETVKLHYYGYTLEKGALKIKTKIAIAISTLGLIFGGGTGLSMLLTSAAHADTAGINFESYSAGVIDGQDGWSATGSAGSGCAAYDEEVVNNVTAPASFGTKSFRISNAVTSGCFSDQAFSKSLAQAAGESGAEGGAYSSAPFNPYYEAQFDLASTVPGAQQTGLSMSVSPDRGDGARMSYLRFEDQADGIHVLFDDYQDKAPFGGVVGDSNGCDGVDDFVETDIVTLDRSVAHTIKFAMAFIDGPRNDVVRVYIDGNLKHTGTSWEDYFRYCEGNQTRTVDSLLFRVGGTAVPANDGNGYLVDNLNLVSSSIPNDFFEAAPAIAARLLKDANIQPRYGNGKTGGNHISDVANKMGPTTDFMGVKKNDSSAYECAVAKFLETKPNPALVTSSVACYELVQSLNVNSNDIDGENSNSLTSGNYRFDISGTWQNRGFESVDADYTSSDGWTTHLSGPGAPGTWNEKLLDVRINNQFVDWGPYSTTHTYSHIFTGSGTSVNFGVFDGDVTTGNQNPGWFGDNVGSMTVNIYRTY